jgi:hypothetical protein
MEYAKGMVDCSLSITVFMMENGRTTERMVMEHYIILMEIFMKGAGRMIGQMGMEFILIRLGRNIQGSGKMISRMGTGLKNGTMGRSTRENTKTDTKKARVHFIFQTGMSTLVNFLIMNYTGKENMCGKIKKSMLASGKTIKCMELAQQTGMMGESTMVNIRMI